MRILIISASFFPRKSPRAYRWTSICQYWTQLGITCDVVCSEEESTTSDTHLSQINIYRARDVAPKPKNKTKNYNSRSETGNGRWFLRLIKNAKNRLLKGIAVSFRWPDSKWFWIYPAYKKAKTLTKKYDYDAMVTVALPFSSHIVGYLLKLQGNKAPWICDYGDPFSFLNLTPTNNSLLYNKLNILVERKILKKSRKISVTTNETVKEYNHRLKIPPSWFKVIPPLFDKQHMLLYRAVCKKHTANDDVIRFLYTGTFYREIRNPSGLFRFLNDLKCHLSEKRIELHIYGKLNDYHKDFDLYTSDYKSWVHLHGVVAKQELINAYADASILINLGNKTSYQLPSKVVEYMSTGLPIINIASIEEDLSHKTLSNYPSSITIYEKDLSNKETLEKTSDFVLKTKKVDDQKVDKIINKFSVDQVGKQYLDLLYL